MDGHLKGRNPSFEEYDGYVREQSFRELQEIKQMRTKIQLLARHQRSKALLVE